MLAIVWGRGNSSTAWHPSDSPIFERKPWRCPFIVMFYLLVILLGSTRLDINRVVLLGNDLTCDERGEQGERRGSGAPSPVLDEWYVPNVSIIFDAPCLFMHHLLCVLLHFVKFLSIFWNQPINEMPQCQFPVFCCFCVLEKLHRKYSWNWTKQKSKFLFFPTRDGVQSKDGGGQRAATPCHGAGHP
jgi:hypothetical protein